VVGRAGIAVVGALMAAVLAGCAATPEQQLPACPPATTAASATCLITSAQRVINDAGAAPTELTEAGRRAQDAYRQLGDHPEWDNPVFAALPPPERDQAQHAVDAYRQLVSLAGPPALDLPAWRVVEPLPVDTLRGFYRAAQQRFGIDWTVLAGIHLVETRMGRVVGLSSAGAQGPMQFMPATWAAYGMGGNVWEPKDAIMGAANYLAANGGRDPARLNRALRRYNNDDRYVRAVRDYAAMMAANPRALAGLHAWRVEYRTVAGTIPLPTGYTQPTRIPVGQWLAANRSEGER
jgi:membrane-bound lytic murein transglycosylase B